MVFVGLLGLVGFIGNGLVVFVFLRRLPAGTQVFRHFPIYLLFIGVSLLFVVCTLKTDQHLRLSKAKTNSVWKILYFEKSAGVL